MGEAGEAKHAVWPNGDMTTVRIRRDVGSVRIGVDDGTDYWALTVKVDQAVWLRDTLTALLPDGGLLKAVKHLRELLRDNPDIRLEARNFMDIPLAGAFEAVDKAIEQAEGRQP